MTKKIRDSLFESMEICEDLQNGYRQETEEELEQMMDDFIFCETADDLRDNESMNHWMIMFKSHAPELWRAQYGDVENWEDLSDDEILDFYDMIREFFSER